jgi:hypothetical protein
MLYPYQDEPPSVGIAPLPVMQGGRVVAQTEAFALQISGQDGEGAFQDIYFAAEGDGALYTFAGHRCGEAVYFVEQGT